MRARAVPLAPLVNALADTGTLNGLTPEGTRTRHAIIAAHRHPRVSLATCDTHGQHPAPIGRIAYAIGADAITCETTGARLAPIYRGE